MPALRAELRDLRGDCGIVFSFSLFVFFDRRVFDRGRATVATFARSGPTSPLPSGCTRFDMKTTNVCETGSIQTLVPVNPV
jgi:hypothetical protein